MKTYLMPLLAAFALTIGTAAAQTTTPTAPAPGQMHGQGHGRGHGGMHGTPDEMAQRQSQRLTQELGLNADQTAKVQQILLARGQEMQAMRGQGQAKDAANRDQMREQMKANRAKYDEQFKAVLTPEQYTKYTTQQAEHKGHGGKGYGRMDGDKAKFKQDKIKMKADAKATKVKVKADK